MKHKVKHVHFVGMRRIAVSPGAGAPVSGDATGQIGESRRCDGVGGAS